MRAVLQYPGFDPVAIAVDLGPVTLAVRWYALAYLAGIIIAWWLARRIVTRPDLWGGTAPIDLPRLEGLVTWVILGIILGGRLGYVLFYQPGYFLANPAEILAVWKGGMSFHGGLVGTAVAAWLYCRRHGLAPLRIADLMAAVTPPGLFLGRIANFINAELWGRPTALPWGIVPPPGSAPPCPPPWPAVCARHPSQLYEAALEGLVLGAVLLWLVWRRRALAFPGRSLGVFLAGYGFARFLVEFVRQPDPQFAGPGNPLGLALHVDGWGLTMGQLLSLPMIALGAWFVHRSRGRA